MTVLKYFNHIEPSEEEKIQSVLLKPDGLLTFLMPSSAIETANSAVTEILANTPD